VDTKNSTINLTIVCGMEETNIVKNTNKINKAKLKDLYLAATEFKEAKPWEWMNEDDLICIENPEDKSIGFCSIMAVQMFTSRWLYI